MSKHFYFKKFWTKVYPGTVAMKGYSAFPKAPASLEPQHQVVSSHMQDTRGQGEGGHTPLQRCSRCILQPRSQVTGQEYFVGNILNKTKLFAILFRVLLHNIDKIIQNQWFVCTQLNARQFYLILSISYPCKKLHEMNTHWLRFCLLKMELYLSCAWSICKFGDKIFAH